MVLTKNKASGLDLEWIEFYILYIYANPWISEVSGVGWGILFYQDFT